jgi:putative membrane protein
MLTSDQATKIERAVSEAEAATASEIAVCVLRAAGDDRGVAAIVGALAFALVDGLGTSIWWNISPLIWIGVAFVTAVAVFLACDRFDLGLRLLPARLLVKDARRAARAVFLDQGLDTVAERNAVLLFVARAERYVEILPDRVAAAAIDPARWAEIVESFRQQVRSADVGDAVAGAVAKIGAVCAVPFPAGAGNPDTLPNRPIQS